MKEIKKLIKKLDKVDAEFRKSISHFRGSINDLRKILKIGEERNRLDKKITNMFRSRIRK